MGKSRVSGNRGGGMGGDENFTDELNESTYVTDAGIEVDVSGLTYPEGFQSNVDIWVGSDMIHSPDQAMGSIKELQYIESHMETTTDSLTRIEHVGKGHNITTSDLKSIKKNLIGKELELGGKLKAFSRTREATEKYMDKEMPGSGTFVIFKTEGKVRHFNVNNWNKEFPYEEESWVSSGKWQITGVKNISKDYNSNPMAQTKKVYEVRIKQVKDSFKGVQNSPDPFDEKYHDDNDPSGINREKFEADSNKFFEEWMKYED